MSPGGRPPVGTPINVRLGDELLAQVDAYRERFDISRAEVIRRAVSQYMWDDEMTRMGNKMERNQAKVPCLSCGSRGKHAKGCKLAAAETGARHG